MCNRPEPRSEAGLEVMIVTGLLVVLGAVMFGVIYLGLWLSS